MIEKKFIHVLPDEPYKQTTAKNKTVECTYKGAQYLVVRMLEESGTCLNVERYGDDKEAVELSIVDDGPIYDFFVLDANEFPWEAAYLTGAYSTESVPNYETVLPNGEKWIYEYNDLHGVIQHCHAQNSLKYDKNLKVFTRPPYVTHSINPVEFQESVANQKKEFDKILAGDLSKYSNKTIEEIQAYANFLASISTTYKGVDHWKIGFPTWPNFN